MVVDINKAAIEAEESETTFSPSERLEAYTKAALNLTGRQIGMLRLACDLGLIEDEPAYFLDAIRLKRRDRARKIN